MLKEVKYPHWKTMYEELIYFKKRKRWPGGRLPKWVETLSLNYQETFESQPSAILFFIEGFREIVSQLKRELMTVSNKEGSKTAKNR